MVTIKKKPNKQSKIKIIIKQTKIKYPPPPPPPKKKKKIKNLYNHLPGTGQKTPRTNASPPIHTPKNKNKTNLRERERERHKKTKKQTKANK